MPGTAKVHPVKHSAITLSNQQGWQLILHTFCDGHVPHNANLASFPCQTASARSTCRATRFILRYGKTTLPQSLEEVASSRQLQYSPGHRALSTASTALTPATRSSSLGTETFCRSSRQHSRICPHMNIALCRIWCNVRCANSRDETALPLQLGGRRTKD